MERLMDKPGANSAINMATEVGTRRYGWGAVQGGYKPGQLAKFAGGLDYAAVAQGISRLGKRLKNGVKLDRDFANVYTNLSNVET